MKEFQVNVSFEEEKEEETIVKDPPLISASECPQNESEIAGLFKTVGLDDLSNDIS